jgi:hypothetical protein
MANSVSTRKTILDMRARHTQARVEWKETIVTVADVICSFLCEQIAPRNSARNVYILLPRSVTTTGMTSSLIEELKTSGFLVSLFWGETSDASTLTTSDGDLWEQNDTIWQSIFFVKSVWESKRPILRVENNWFE